MKKFIFAACIALFFSLSACADVNITVGYDSEACKLTWIIEGADTTISIYVGNTFIGDTFIGESGHLINDHGIAPGTYAVYGKDSTPGKYHLGEITIANPSESNTVATSGICGRSITWELDSSGTLFLHGTGNMYNWYNGDDLPWYDVRDNIYKIQISYGITSIGSFSFYGCSELTSIDIPSSVNYIGEAAFAHCTKLPYIYIPDSVSAINDSSFELCTSLSSIRIPDIVTSIGDCAFFECQFLSEVTLPSSLTSIGIWAFHSCCNLTSITIPPNITSIQQYAFADCVNLEQVAFLNASSSNIENNIFNNCAPIIFCDKDSAMHTWAKNLGFKVQYLENETNPWQIILFADSTMHIGEYNVLEVITLPKTSDEYEISWSSTIPSVANVNNGVLIAFSAGRTTITASCGDIMESIEITVVPNSNVVLFPSSTKVIEAESFQKTGVEIVVLPSTCNTIGSKAFADCSQLVSVYMPDSVTSIADDAFSGSANVTFICESANYASEFAEGKGIYWTIE